MSIFVLRLRDGNCVIATADNEDHARKTVELLATSEVVTVRELDAFAAQFILNDNGELSATLLDKQTISDLHSMSIRCSKRQMRNRMLILVYLKRTARQMRCGLAGQQDVTHKAGMSGTSR